MNRFHNVAYRDEFYHTSNFGLGETPGGPHSHAIDRVPNNLATLRFTGAGCGPKKCKKSLLFKHWPLVEFSDYFWKIL